MIPVALVLLIVFLGLLLIIRQCLHGTENRYKDGRVRFYSARNMNEYVTLRPKRDLDSRVIRALIRKDDPIYFCGVLLLKSMIVAIVAIGVTISIVKS